MENQPTKIPRLREPRYARSPRTCLDLKPSPISFETRPPLIKRAASMSQIAKYKPLTPEQFNVKYKRYPHKFCKKTCVICCMKKPHPKSKLGKSKMDCATACTQTLPPKPIPKRWNAETQTKMVKIMEIKSSARRFETKTLKEKSANSYFAMSIGIWISVLLVMVAIIAVFLIKRANTLYWVMRSEVNHPRSVMEKFFSLFYRDQVVGDVPSDRSVALVNEPRIVLPVSLSILLIFGLGHLF